MSTGTPNLPVTPIRSAAMTSQNGATDIYSKLKESSSQIDLKESQRLSEALAIREAPEKVDISAMQPPPNIKDPPASQVIVDQDEHDAESNVVIHERAASTQELEPFDWDDFQARYDQAMAEAKAREETLLHEFNELANYFGVWAAAASEYDDDRALKRLRTREAYIQTAEQSLDEKKKHYTQVVEAFKNALALLGGP